MKPYNYTRQEQRSYEEKPLKSFRKDESRESMNNMLTMLNSPLELERSVNPDGTNWKSVLDICACKNNKNLTCIKLY